MSDSTKLVSLFEAALDIEAASERAAFLDEACGANHELRAQVEKLLKSHEEAGSFLDGPAPELAATVLPQRPNNDLNKVLDAGLTRGFDVDVLCWFRSYAAIFTDYPNRGRAPMQRARCYVALFHFVKIERNVQVERCKLTDLRSPVGLK